jgi:hypothetical protein
VQERVGDGPWKNVGQAGGRATNFTRTLSAPGTYRYQVAALRTAGSGDDTVQSAWSGPANEPKQIVVAEPPRPETTTTTTPASSAEGSPEPPPPADPGDPTVPPAPPQVTSAGAPNDPAAPGATPDGSTDTSRTGAAVVSPIQHGAPGSVRSGGATVGGLAAPPSTKPPREPQEGEEPEGPDTGFSAELPYKQNGESAEEGDGGVGRVLVGLPEAIGGDETRQMLVPLAGGLLLFVFAMHVLYISRRAAPEAPLDPE